MKKIFITIVLLFYHVLCYADTWTEKGNYDTSWYDDISNSFNIKTAKELAGLAYLCNNGTSFTGKTINLQADINLDDYDWIPISTFGGTLNGNYHKIVNLHLLKWKDSYSPLPGYISNSSTGFIINNTGLLKNIDIQGSASVETCKNISGFVLYNNGNISNCIIDVIINDKRFFYPESSIGGICAINKGNIINCINKGKISVLGPTQYNSHKICVGGIVGQNEGQITNCFNSGNIYAVYGDYDDPCYGYSGGICGYNTGAIKNAVSIADITMDEIYKEYGGGIVAYNSGIIDNTYYSSAKTVTAKNINNEGLRLGEAQLNNTSYAFTDLLNQNVSALSDADICFWANSVSQNENIPFLLNGFAANTRIGNISQNNAIFKAIPTDIVSTAIIHKGFEYKRKNDLSYTKAYASDEFSVEVSDLTLSETYQVRAFVTTNNSTVYFNEIEFSTTPISVNTKEAINVTATSAILKGETQLGLTAIKSQGFLWKAENESDYHIAYTEGTEFGYELEDLAPNTMYNYQAFILTADGETFYGKEMSFTTQPIAITFNDNTVIDRNQINLKGNINMKLATDVTVEYKKATDSNYSKTIVRSESDGSFECSLSGLLPNTYYDCRAYIIYNSTYSYSPISTFKTINVQVQTLTPILGTSVTFRGEVIGGTNTGTVGFEYRNANYPDLMASDFIYAVLDNTSFLIKTYNVINGNEYKYRAFYQNEDNIRTYGEWIYFTPNDVISDINDIVKENESKNIISYYDVQGNKLNKPQKGITIIHYSDGSVHKIFIK